MSNRTMPGPRALAIADGLTRTGRANDVDYLPPFLRLRASHGGFANWLDAHHPRGKPEWVKLFKSTFRFTGGEIVGEFLMSLGYLPGAHAADCPVAATITALRPPWQANPAVSS